MFRYRSPARPRIIPALLMLLVSLHAPMQAGAQHEGDHAALPPRPAAQARDTALGVALPAAGAVSWQRIVQNGVAVDLTLLQSEAGRGGQVVEGQETLLRLQLSDRESGRPLTDLHPIGWVSRRLEGIETTPEMCRQRIGSFAEGTLRARPAVDLNSYYLLTTTTQGTILVIDPIGGLTRTKLYTSIPLGSPIDDWVLSPDSRQLFVSLPEAGKVAVVDTDRWKVLTQLEVGATPRRLVLQPASERLWVSLANGVAVIDISSRKVTGGLKLGTAPQAMAFAADGKRGFVVSAEAGTLTVIDAAEGTKVREVVTGPRPSDVAVAPLSGAVFVTHEGDGSIVVVDPASLEVAARIQAKPGLRSIRFPPADPHTDTGDAHGHAGHAGHAGQGRPSAGGRFGYVVNPAANEVYVVDAANRVLVHTIDVPAGPDQIGFTASFAYLRSARSAQIRMLPLSDPTADGTGRLEVFDAGFAPPGFSTASRTEDVIASAPDMHDAVYVANPKEKVVYYFHYMEGMRMPMYSGSFTTYGYEPTAVRLVGRNLSETEPGVYAATLRAPDAGEYDMVFLLPDPRVVHCFGFTLQADPALQTGRVRLALEPLGGGPPIQVGENLLRFRLSDPVMGISRAGVEDITVQLAGTDGWRYRAVAHPTVDGTYEIEFPIPGAGLYYLSFESPSLGVGLSDRSPLVLQARENSDAR